MGRKTQSGQFLIETVILTLFFVGLFLSAVIVTEDASERRSRFEFSSERKFKKALNENDRKIPKF